MYEKRPVSGILLFDKPAGCSSNQALQKVKHLYAAQKAGHTGSLDPIATGMLPICFGWATRFAGFLLSSEKAYTVTARLGLSTETGDSEGVVINSRTIPLLSPEKIESYLAALRGAIQQVPPMYSALKHQGKRLYQLAREGKVVPRAPRSVFIRSLVLRNIDAKSIELEVVCSKGTYIRSLVEDLGEALGCGAHVTALRRLWVAPYQDETMVDLETLSQYSENKAALDKFLLPLGTVFSQLPEMRLSQEAFRDLQQGKRLNSQNLVDCVVTGDVRFVDQSGDFLGLGLVSEEGIVQVKRLLPLQ